MKKESHITEFTAKKGKGLHIRVTTSRNGRRYAVDGGRLYYSDYPTKADCMRHAKRIRDEIMSDLGRPRASIYPTAAELFERSFDFMPVAYSTRDTLTRHWRNAEPQDKPINEITLADLQLAVNRYAETHSQKQTDLMLQQWRRVYKTAFYLQIPVVDVSRMVLKPKSKVITKVRNMETDYDTFMDALDVLSASPNWLAPTAIDICWLMYYTGMRVTEVCGLQKADIDLDRSVIHVRRNCGSNALKSADLVPLKTAKSLRDVPIADGLKPVLLHALDRAEGEQLFTWWDGSLLSPTRITNYVLLECRRHGVTFSLYRLRHLFSADLFREGTNPKVIQSLMGHTSSNMSLYYAFTSEAERAEAVNKRKPS